MVGFIFVSKILQSTVLGILGPTALDDGFRDAYIAHSVYFNSW